MLARILSLAVVTTCVSSVASAAVISADHPSFGVGTLTRDTDQGLDFLDLTLSTNRSTNNVSGEFVEGGDFEGFRYATEAEVITLINNFGFLPGAVAGEEVHGDGGEPLSGLIDLLGVTEEGFLGGLPVFLPPVHFTASAGYAQTDPVPGRGLSFFFITVNDETSFPFPLPSFPSIDAVFVQRFPVPNIDITSTRGFFLVQAIPEPGSITLFGIAAGMLGIGWRRCRKKQTLSNH